MRRDVFCVGGTWLEETDFWPMGPPETRIEMPGDLTLGLHIPHPFGPSSDAMLSVRAVAGNGNDGGRITLAIGTVICRETPMDPPQSNPRRHPYREDSDFTKGFTSE